MMSLDCLEASLNASLDLGVDFLVAFAGFVAGDILVFGFEVWR
jgi:hypothetical protein